MISYSRRKKTDYEHIRSLIPLYVRGRLEDRERSEVECAIGEHPELKKEVEEWEKIYRAYRAMEEGLPEPSPDLYARIVDRIEKKREDTRIERLKQWFSILKPSPAVSITIIMVQLFIIILGGAYIIKEKAGYRTLSSAGSVQSDLVRINVVFKADATERDIRSLLHDVNGKILDGPYASGLYIIGVQPDDIDAALTRLRHSPIIVLSERSY